MKKIFFILMLLPFMSVAEEQRVEHFSGLPAETLPDAVRNFVDYSEKLANIITEAQDGLTNENIASIHELTYTLEIALEKIHADLGALKETLESLHVASEEFNADAVSEYAQAFLQVVEQLNADED